MANLLVASLLILSIYLPSLLATHDSSITPIESDESFVNLHVVEDICPRQDSNTTLPSASICQFKEEIHCRVDEECKIGSKCCPVDDCNRMCIDLKDGSVSKPKVTGPFIRTQRRKRQSFGCVACACVRNCRSDRDCRNAGRRKRCYKNSCSSYCTQ